MSSEVSRLLQSFTDVMCEINKNFWSYCNFCSRKVPPKDVDLRNQTFVVTGGNRGFGRGVTIELVARGATVIIGARGAETASKVIQECLKLYPNSPRVTYFQLDLTNFDSINGFSDNVHEVCSKYGLKGLINNAALTDLMFNISSVSNQEKMELTWAVNIFGLAYLTNSLMKLLLKAPDGSTIVNVSSLAHLVVPCVDTCGPMVRGRPFESFSIYAETKLALMFYTKQLAKQLKGKNVHVFGVDPGFSIKRWAMARPLMRTPIDGSRSIIFPILFERADYDVKKWYTG